MSALQVSRILVFFADNFDLFSIHVIFFCIFYINLNVPLLFFFLLLLFFLLSSIFTCLSHIFSYFNYKIFHYIFVFHSCPSPAICLFISPPSIFLFCVPVTLIYNFSSFFIIYLHVYSISSRSRHIFTLVRPVTSVCRSSLTRTYTKTSFLILLLLHFCFPSPSPSLVFPHRCPF